MCSAPQQAEASQDFLKSCSAEEVTCVAEGGAEEDGKLDLHWIFIAEIPKRSSLQGWIGVCVFVLVDDANSERACDTLLMCIVTVLNHGLRNGGGVGDVLRKPSKNVSVL